MLKKINRQEAIQKFPNLPLRHYDREQEKDIFNYPRVFANYILTLPSRSYKGHIKLTGLELEHLMNYLACDNFIFLGDQDTPWLKRWNTYDNFQDSLQYLAGHKIGKRFNGALQVDRSEILVFTRHLAWLVRTNAVLPYVHFIDPQQNIIGNICQYGNLHCSTLNKKADNQFKAFVSASRLEFIQNQQCSNTFSKGGKIKERSITV